MPCRQPDLGNAQRLEQLRSLIEAEPGDGLKLIRNLRNNPICSIYVDESVPCVSIAWKRYATSAQFRYVHENVIALLKEHDLNGVLNNTTSLPTIHTDDQRWIIDDWMPRATTAGLAVAATKRPVAYFGRLAVDHVWSQAIGGASMRCFDNLEASRQWLKSLIS